MPIQNRKIKLTLIFLLILLSISAFSVIGIVVAFNTKKDNEPIKAASCSKHASCCDIRTSFSVDEYTTYDYFHVYSLKPLVEFCRKKPSFTFVDKTLFLEDNQSGGYNLLSSSYVGIFYQFAGKFYGQGHSITAHVNLGYLTAVRHGTSHGTQTETYTINSRYSIICDTLLSGGLIRDVKFASCGIWIDDDTYESDSGIIAVTVNSGATIQSCIVDSGSIVSSIDRKYEPIAGSIAAFNSGTIKNCIVQGTIKYGGEKLGWGKDPGLYVYGITGSNSGTIKNNVVSASFSKYSGSSGGVDYNSEYCYHSGNNGAYSSLANAKGNLGTDSSSVGGAHSTENGNADWYEHPSYNSGNPYLRAFIPSWKDVFIKTTLNGSDNSDCGYITGEPTEIKVPTSVTLPSIDSTEETVEIWGVDYTATANDYYKFVGWSGSGTEFKADFCHVPVRVKFDTAYDLMVEDESNVHPLPSSAYLPLKHNSVITCDNDISDDNKLTYEYTNVTFGGITESKRTVTYNINSEIYDFVNFFRISTQKEDGTWEVVETSDGPYTVQGDLSDPEKIVVKISPVVRRKGTPIIFNPISINNGQTTISPTNNGEDLSDNTIIMPINTSLTCATEDYTTDDGYAAQKIVYNIINDYNNKFKVVYDLGVFYQKSDFGLELNQSGSYNIEADCGLEVTPTVTQIAEYISFGNAIDSYNNKGLPITPELTITQEDEVKTVQNNSFLVKLPYVSSSVITGDQISYTFTLKNDETVTATWDISEAKSYGYAFEVYRLSDSVLKPYLIQQYSKVIFKDINNAGYTIKPTWNSSGHEFDDQILLIDFERIWFDCYNKSTKEIIYKVECTGTNGGTTEITIKYMIEPEAFKDLANDFTYDPESGGNEEKADGIIFPSYGTQGDYLTLDDTVIIVEPVIMYKQYGGSYGGASGN